MMQMLSLKTGFLAATLAFAAGAAVLGTPSEATAGGCGNLKIAVVKKYCEANGEKSIKKAMKAAQKKAEADGAKIGGKEIKCSSCHEDQKVYKLTSNANDDFNKYMAKHFGK